MSHPSPRSTLLPYTTLFRSWNYWFQYLPDHFASHDAFGSAERLIAPGFPGTASPDNFPRNPLNNTSGSQADGDRKSTRLNSSHLVISYAVFCLKKKIDITDY